MQYFNEGTWLGPEEAAYPSGTLRHSRRRAVAMCPDGTTRLCVVGIPDTYFSIPARVHVAGLTVSGYVSVNTDHNVLEFHATGKHRGIFEAP